MKMFLRILIIFIVIISLVSLNRINNVRIIEHKNEEEFIWLPMDGDAVFEFDREKYNGTSIGFVVNDIDDAKKAFYEVVYNEVPDFFKIINNTYHIKHDLEKGKFIIYYKGIYNIQGYYAVIYEGDNKIYIIRMKM